MAQQFLNDFAKVEVIVTDRKGNGQHLTVDRASNVESEFNAPCDYYEFCNSFNRFDYYDIVFKFRAEVHDGILYSIKNIKAPIPSKKPKSRKRKIHGATT